MYEIMSKTSLSLSVKRISIHAPFVVRHAKAGQFVIIRVNEQGERIPMTIHESNPVTGQITIIYQIVGASTTELDQLSVGDHLQDVCGPLGRKTEIEGVSRALIVGGGLGSAIAYPVAKALKDQGSYVDAVLGYKNQSLVILESQFKDVSNNVLVTTDDGSYGQKGFVTDAIKTLLDDHGSYDYVFAVGPLVMMKYVSLLTKPYGIKTSVSMNTIMVDGTGMCGGCRLTVAGKTVFACVDGPDFDGHEVDFDEAIHRNQMYHGFETEKHNEVCRRLKVNSHEHDH
jgi:ferredoxin/flavodoxin---NADP+ reductase